ncbi:MAG: hypothetical protein JWP38_2914 [Herbaspirillum sp.]|nr:hypothetical protein [Herbaspirillum sp.]
MYNKNLDQFLMFYSQSEAGNGLTRGLDSDISRRTYVPTKLDRELLGAVLAGSLRLVILTGNAGDGKTAFIQKLEEQAESRGAENHIRNNLGAKFTLNGRAFSALYDGSVETSDQSNKEMLASFFAEMAGDAPPGGSTCLVVAMNEGKLRDFLSHVKGFSWLGKTLFSHLDHGTVLPDQIVLVNLNLRAVVDADAEQSDGLFDQILDRFVAEEFWTDCDGCPARNRCPVKFNVDTFRTRPIGGITEKDLEVAVELNESAKLARARFKVIFQILHFRKRIHLTVRDLRSALAYTLFGKKTCAQIDAEVRSDTSDFTRSFYFNAMFDPNEKDRVIGLLREFDVGLAASPSLDSQLSFTRPTSPDFKNLFHSFQNHRNPSKGRSDSDQIDFAELFRQKPQSLDARTPERLEAAKRYVQAARRKLYFEGRFPDENIKEKTMPSQLLPYDNLTDFFSFIASGTDAGGRLKEAIILAISRSEAIYDGQRGKENICIRTRHNAASQVKAFFVYPADQFALSLPVAGTQGRFIEFLPANIVLQHVERNVTLEISLDLYEMLMRIRDGYVPAAGEMRAFFLNLLMFKKQLMATPSERLLITDNDYRIYQLTRTSSNGVVLSSLT